jgi:nicotinamide-nucleotide amidase
MKTAEILAIGSELLGSVRVDTNSLWMTSQLELLGIEVVAKSAVTDQLDVIVAQLKLALTRADLVICTGGLGPTEDDRTREAVSLALERPLREQEALVTELQGKFKSFGREMTDNNRRQAFIPEGAEVFPNPKGTAPGFQVPITGHRAQLLLVFPGPPREMKPMFTTQFFEPRRALAHQEHVKRQVLKVIGLGESALDKRIAPFYKDLENPQTTILFTPHDLEIHLLARGSDEAACDLLLDHLRGQMMTELGEAVYSTKAETLPQVLGQLLKDSGLTLCTAESLTGGLVGSRITEVAGSSDYFLASLVTYSEKAKTELLGVPADLIAEHGAVSSQVAEAMARGAAERTGADLSLSLTGVAGPGGGTEKEPVGAVYLGLHSARGTEHRRITFPGDRELIRIRAAEAGLEMVRRAILSAWSSSADC